MNDNDKVYAYLSEKNFENRESLMIDIENDQLLGEDAFLLDRLMHKMKANVVPKKEKIQQIQYRYEILKI